MNEETVAFKPLGEVGICYARLSTEEGRRAFAYNDATGKRVSCKPSGNLSIAIGVNLETGLDNEEIDWLSQHRLTKLSDQLNAFAWYKPLDPVRKSVVLDIAFNTGIGGLLHFPHLIAALARSDWASAATECRLSDLEYAKSPGLKTRYEALAHLLLVGDI